MVFEGRGDKLVVRLQGEVIQIEPWGEDALRFRATRGRGVVDDPDLTPHLLPRGGGGAEVRVGDSGAVVRNGKIVAEVGAGGEVRYLSSSGRVLLEELWIDPRRARNGEVLKARNYRALSSDLYRIQVYFKAYDDERLYGMGQHPVGYLNLKGCVLELAHKNTQINIPFLLSTRGYGFIWNSPSVGLAAFAKNYTMWLSEASKQIDYIVIAGDTPREIVRKYTAIVGRAPPLPEWALGLWQSKLRYRTQEELLSVAREYSKRDIPLSMIVIDFFHWPRLGDFKLDPKFWPDPKRMVEELESMGVRLLVSIWPMAELDSENYQESVEKRLLVRTEKGLPILHTFRGFASYYDFTNPEARRYVWEKVRENYYRYGIKNYWLDEAEPEMGMPGIGYDNISPYDLDNVRYHLGNGLEVSNLYPFYYAMAFHDGLRSVGEDDFVLLIRAAWHGSQRFRVVVWSGDIPSTFDSLRRQIKAGLNTAICGITWWTTDTAGFYGGNPSDPRYQELMVRWFQWSTFCPVLRLHGCREPGPRNSLKCPAEELTCGPNEIWSFGDRAYRVMRGFVFIREGLRGYIAEQARISYEEGVPLMRPLFIDFPDDEAVYDVEDEYMFGSDMLVAPVYEEGARSRKVYLPRGVEWIYAWAGETQSGGRWVEVETPLEIIPIFLRRGTKIDLEIFKKYLETLKQG